eukprot:CCRYP_010427-RE/>CCRYP_010427-RE protein AED:0.49 eAED:0.94 QI:0/0/0/1/0/0/3/0/66
MDCSLYLYIDLGGDAPWSEYVQGWRQRTPTEDTGVKFLVHTAHAARRADQGAESSCFASSSDIARA